MALGMLPADPRAKESCSNIGIDRRCASRSRRDSMCHGSEKIVEAMETRGEEYGKIAGRREEAMVVYGRLDEPFGPIWESLEGSETAGSASRDRSSIKLPAARFPGVRGMCSSMKMS